MSLNETSYLPIIRIIRMLTFRIPACSPSSDCIPPLCPANSNPLEREVMSFFLIYITTVFEPFATSQLRVHIRIVLTVDTALPAALLFDVLCPIVPELLQAIVVTHYPDPGQNKPSNQNSMVHKNNKHNPTELPILDVRTVYVNGLTIKVPADAKQKHYRRQYVENHRKDS